MTSTEFGYCHLHEEPVDEDTYEYKGCWGCYHFELSEDFPYYTVRSGASKLGVSCSTIRRWVRSGKLEGRLFRQIRRNGNLPSPKHYLITEESIKEVESEGQK